MSYKDSRERKEEAEKKRLTKPGLPNSSQKMQHSHMFSDFLHRVKAEASYGSYLDIRSCVKVEVAVLGFLSLIVRTVFVGVNRH